MIKLNIPTYKCEHCRRLFQVERYAIKHEASCKKNPLNIRACFDCKFCEKMKADVLLNYGDEFGRQVEAYRDLFYCSKKDEYLLPPKAEHKGNAYETDKSNEPMPLSCELKIIREY